MRKTLITLALAATTLAAPAFAATMMRDDSGSIRHRGRTMNIHVMRMDDGQVMYGLTKPQLERIMGRRLDSFYTFNERSTDGSGR